MDGRTGVWPLASFAAAALLLTISFDAGAQSVVYHLHNEASTTSGFKQLRTEGPDVAQATIQTAALQGAATGEKQIAQFNTAVGAPGTAGKIPTGAAVAITAWMRKTANLGTMFPRVKVRLNSSTGTALCTATGTTALTTTLTAYALSCTTSANITLTALDRWYVWVGVNLTVGSSSGAFRGELGIEGALSGPADSRVDVPSALPPPTITSLSPTAGPVGQVVTITGNNFRTQQFTSAVKFYNNRTATVSSWSNNSIIVTVPASSTTGNVTVTVAGTTSAGVPFTVGAVPVIAQVSPNAGLPGDAVVVTGSGFGATKGSSTVRFNGLTAATASWSATSITAVVPAGATTGNVIVTVAGVPSVGTPFTVPTLTAIAVGPAHLTVPLKSRQRYKAVGTYSNGTVRDVTNAATWSSAAAAVAQVDAAGVVTALSKGTSTIAATSGSVVGSTTLSVTSPSFTRVGMMSTSRAYHTATLLADGRVLVAGGQTAGSVALASAEIYDRVTGEFTATGSMRTARIRHTATLLPDGTVLIAGGIQYLPSYQQPAGAEIYNPATGTFSFVGSMSVGRDFHTATRLADGRVLIAGGYHSTPEGGEVAPNEIYTPATFSFAPTGNMANPRYSHAAATLADGRVLVSGGAVDGQMTVTAEIFDPTSETFAATGSMLNARWSHHLGALSTGDVLVVGGLDSCGPTCPAELFNPIAGTWAPTAGVNARAMEATAVLADGSVLIIGGQDDTQYLPYAETFDPTTLTFTAAGAMQTPRSAAQATTLTDGSVLVTGGFNMTWLASAEVFALSSAPPPASTLRITPSNANIAVGQELQFTVVDSIGRTRDDAMWAMDGAGATLETEPVVRLTATAPGVVTLSATIGSTTTETHVTIVSEATVVTGQSLWTSTNGTGLPVKQVVQAVPSPGGPDLYVISGDASRTFIQALALDGRQLWQGSIPVTVNQNATPDGVGGLILTSHYGCDNQHQTRIIAVDGATGEWRWEVVSNSTCAPEAPQFAIRQDAAVVVASPGNTSGLPGLMILDGQSGQPIQTPAIPQSSFTMWDGSVVSGYSRIGAPMVDADGTVYMQYEQRLVAYPPRVANTGIFLLKVAPNGATSTVQLTSVTTDTNLFPGRIIPDGQGGVIATWTFSPSNGSLDPNPLRGAHLNASGTVTEFDVPIQPAQLIKENNIPISPSLALGTTGTTFATYGSQIASFTFSGGTQWTAQPSTAKVEIVSTDDQNGVAAKATDAGGADTLLFYDASGTPTTSPLPSMGASVDLVNGELWTGVLGDEVNLYSGVPIYPSSIWPSWNQRRTNQAVTKAAIEVKCRSISSDPNNPWWRKVLYRVAQHCYIVTREQNGTVSTIEGGELEGRPTGTLEVGVDPGDSKSPNRPTDWTHYWNPTWPWQTDEDAQSRIPCLKQKAVQMNAAQLAYHFLGPNSNRAVVELTEACGITAVKDLLPGRAVGFWVPFTPPWQ